MASRNLAVLEVEPKIVPVTNSKLDTYAKPNPDFFLAVTKQMV
ncbi:hypothetical protein [Methylobacterium gnaphalii]|nr:hypothetical protein [Methylobacterium gnaphalii]GJD69314.1 hypothetical protein MMMDOFMJ_2244 [Methylobacterium gnaphalii]